MYQYVYALEPRSTSGEGKKRCNNCVPITKERSVRICGGGELSGLEQGDPLLEWTGRRVEDKKRSGYNRCDTVDSCDMRLWGGGQGSGG